MTGTHYKCPICGKQFRALYAMLFHLKNEYHIDIEEYIQSCTEYDFTEAKCPICGRLRSMSATGRFVARTCGCKECVEKLTQQTNLLHHGCLSWTSSQEFKQKASHTKSKKYGHPNYRNPEKAKISSLEKHGFEFPQYVCAWNMIQGWNQYVIPEFDKTDYKGLFKTYKWRCQICGSVFESTIHSTRHIDGHEYDRMPRCFNCFPRNHGTSKQERDFIEFCREYFPNLKSNDKALIGKELDIVIPEIKLAIEYNGLYWHSINGSKYNLGQHLSKTQSCEKLGYRLLYVWEDEWTDNQEQIKDRLIQIFNKTETIPILPKYNRCWYSPLQFPSKDVLIEPPTIETRQISRHMFKIENCGYFSIAPLHSESNMV